MRDIEHLLRLYGRANPKNRPKIPTVKKALKLFEAWVNQYRKCRYCEFSLFTSDQGICRLDGSFIHPDTEDCPNIRFHTNLWRKINQKRDLLFAHFNRRTRPRRGPRPNRPSSTPLPASPPRLLRDQLMGPAGSRGLLGQRLHPSAEPDEGGESGLSRKTMRLDVGARRPVRTFSHELATYG